MTRSLVKNLRLKSPGSPSPHHRQSPLHCQRHCPARFYHHHCRLIIITLTIATWDVSAVSLLTGLGGSRGGAGLDGHSSSSNNWTEQTFSTLWISRVLVTNVVWSRQCTHKCGWRQQDQEAKVFKIALHASIFPMTNHLIGWTAIVIPRYSGIITCGSNAVLVIE